MKFRSPSPIASIVAFALFSSAGTAQAEEPRKGIPVASLQYFYGGSATVNDISHSNRLDLESQVVSLRAMYGQRFESSATTLSAEGRYDLMFGSSRLNAGAWHNDTYHFPSLRVVVLHDLGERWGLLGYVVGGVASDMAGFSSDDLRLTVGAGVTYSVSSDLKLTLGVLYTNMADLSPVLPMVDISYRTGNAKFRLSFPNGASAWLSLNPSVDLGIVLGRLSLRYNLHARDRVADEYSLLNVTLGPAARFFLWQGLYLQGEGGYNLRRFKLTQQGQIAYELLTWEGWFASGSMGYMF